MTLRTITTHADNEGVHAEIRDVNGTVLASAYEFAATHGGWESCRAAAIATARRKQDTLAELGPKPADETITFDDSDGLHAVN